MVFLFAFTLYQGIYARLAFRGGADCVMMGGMLSQGVVGIIRVGFVLKKTIDLSLT